MYCYALLKGAVDLNKIAYIWTTCDWLFEWGKYNRHSEMVKMAVFTAVPLFLPTGTPVTCYHIVMLSYSYIWMSQVFLLPFASCSLHEHIVTSTTASYWALWASLCIMQNRNSTAAAFTFCYDFATVKCYVGAIPFCQCQSEGRRCCRALSDVCRGFHCLTSVDWPWYRVFLHFLSKFLISFNFILNIASDA